MFTVTWIAWILSFVVVEGIALVRDQKDDTLSEHFQKWFRTDTNIGRTVFMVIWGLFAMWFGAHIMFSWNPTGYF